MNQPAPPAQFPARISRRLSLALSAIIAMVLLVGGVSLALAVRIYRINREVDQQNAHIHITDQIHTTLHHIIFELQQMHVIGWFDRKDDVRALHHELARHLETFRDLHRDEEGFPEEQRELALFGDIQELAKELTRVTERMIAAPGRDWRLAPMDLAQLNIVSHQVARKSEDLNDIHRLKVSRLLQTSQGLMRVIVALYVAFIAVGGALIALASLAFTRGIATPLRTLADAALEIARGHLDKRVPVRSLNEIGQLSHAFNVMADRLQARERDLRAARDQLEQKVRETQALHRIGTEISSLHQLDQILQSVVEKARELLCTEAAALCMLAADQDELVALATSGPAEAFRSGSPPAARDGLARRTAVTAGNVDAHVQHCTIFQPEFRQTHLAAPLRRGETIVGTICVGGRERRIFTETERELLAGLATQAAIAIENTRLYEEVRGLAALEERERIAREMHDGLAQALGLIHLKLRAAQVELASAGPSRITDDLHEMTAITGRAYEEVRQSIFGLRTMVSRGLGLIPTLTEYLHDFSQQNGIAVDLQIGDERAARFSPEAEVQLVRIIQEALANVRKHAGATQAMVRFDVREGRRCVSVCDDGRGFEPEHVMERASRHFGLQAMRERAEGIGGGLEIESASGQGTTVTARFPL